MNRSLGLVISSQAGIVPNAYQPFLDAWQHVGVVPTESDKKLPTKDQLTACAKDIERVANQILGQSKVISLYAAWMQADESLPFNEGLLKTKTFVEEQFEIVTPCPGFYAAISKLPEEDFHSCIFWIRQRIRQIDKGSKNQKNTQQLARNGASRAQAEWLRWIQQGLVFVLSPPQGSSHAEAKLQRIKSSGP